MTPLTHEELEAAQKGYHKAFTDYVEGEPGEKFILPDSERAKIETWCKPFLDAGIEIGGAFVFHVENEKELVIERVYCNGGGSKFRRTMVMPDGDYLVGIMQKDYPEMKELMSDRVGWFHLHPGYYGEAILSVGDVDEIRKQYPEWPEMCIFNLLVYGNPRTGKFDIGGFAVLHDKVIRFPVVAR